MNCPKCPGKLKKIYIKNIEIDVCWACEGIWFDNGEINDLLKKTPLYELEADIRQNSEIIMPDLDKKEGKCPRCDDSAILLRVPSKKKKIYIDICPRGHGIWLDNGEVFLLKKKEFTTFLEILCDCIETLSAIFPPERFRYALDNYRNRIVRLRKHIHDANKHEI